MPVDGDIILKAGLDTTGITKNIQNLSKSISKGLKNTIRIAFGVRSVFALIRKLRTSLVAGFGDLAQVHQPFNEAMSSIMTSLKLLRNTFAAAFAPIVETVAPIITNFINLIAKAVAAVGQFIATLTGKEYVTAGVTQVDYAESMDKSTKSTKSATTATKKQTKAQKELNREITHFDDLVILHEKQDTDTSTPTPATTTPSATLTNVPIGNAVSEFAKAFKAAWAKADFTDIGRKLGEKLKSALDNIPWVEIKQKLYNIAKSAATFLNGYFGTPGLYTSIGKTIAEAINSVFTAAFSFVINFRWDIWGYAMRDKLIAVLENLDWPLIRNTMIGLGNGIGTALQKALNNRRLWTDIGNTLRNGLNVIVETIKSFLDSISWGDLGTNITEGLKEALRGIQWDKVYGLVDSFGIDLAKFLNGLITRDTFREIGATLSNVLNAVLSGINNFGETFDFTEFGASLAAGFNRFLINFDTDKLASGVSVIVTGIRDGILSFLGTVNWYGFGTTLREAIKKLPWDTILLGIGAVIWRALNSAILFFNGLLDIKPLTSPFTNALKKVKEDIDAIAQSIDFEAISKGISKIVGALQPVAEGFGKGFLTFFEVLKKIGTAFFQTLGPALETIGAGLEKIPPEILEALGTALGFIVGYLTIMKTLGLLGYITTHLPLIGPALKTIKSVGSSVFTLVPGWSVHLLGLAAAVTAVLSVLEATKEQVASTEEELSALDDTHQTTIDILKEVGSQYGLTTQDIYEMAWQMHGLNNEHSDLDGGIRLLNSRLVASGISVDDFTQSLSEAAQVAQNEGKDINDVSTYIENVGSSAETSGEQTDSIYDSLDSLNGLSLLTPLKLALISAAIKGLGDKGKLSKDDVEKLQGIIDDFDDDKPVESMNNIAEAMDDSGITAKEFEETLRTELPKATRHMTTAEKNMVKDAENISNNFNLAGKNAIIGLVGSMQSGSKDVTKVSKSVAKDSLLGTFEDELEEHSPSKAMARIGDYAIQGLKNGLSRNARTVSQAVSAISSSMLTSFDSGASWYSVGSNIASGIYRGLIDHNANLEVLAWNTAVRMYNSACRALGIASPSKKFAWVGEMVVKGLSEGVTEYQDFATDAVSNLTDAMTREAEKTNPSITISTAIDEWINSLDAVLTKFSDTVVNKFELLTNTLIRLGSLSGGIPAVAQGMVIPSAIRTSGTASDTATNMTRMLENLSANQITVDELRPLLIEMFQDYMNLGWYVGDEQLARHVNNGNLLLDRRYSIIKT